MNINISYEGSREWKAKVRNGDYKAVGPRKFLAIACLDAIELGLEHTVDAHEIRDLLYFRWVA